MPKDGKTEVMTILKDVGHPAIARSLLDLGIIKKVEVEEKDAMVMMLFPFPGIPIKDALIRSIAEPPEKAGYSVKVETGIMNQDEVQAFLAMEEKAWKGL